LRQYFRFFHLRHSICSLHIPTDYVCLPEFLTTTFCRKMFSDKFICVQKDILPPPPHTKKDPFFGTQRVTEKSIFAVTWGVATGQGRPGGSRSLFEREVAAADRAGESNGGHSLAGGARGTFLRGSHPIGRSLKCRPGGKNHLCRAEAAESNAIAQSPNGGGRWRAGWWCGNGSLIQTLSIGVARAWNGCV
jgi:hypothetical protein